MNEQFSLIGLKNNSIKNTMYMYHMVFTEKTNHQSDFFFFLSNLIAV